MTVTKVAQDLVRTVTVLTRSGLLGPIRPDRFVNMATALWGESVSATRKRFGRAVQSSSVSA